MCSTNVAFNMKTVENVLIFLVEFLRLKHFWSLFSKKNSLNFLRCVIVCPVHTNIVFAVLMAPRRDKCANRTRAMFIMQSAPLF